LIETDEDQAKLKRAIDERYSMVHCLGRTIEQGSPEWDAIVKTITPIDLVPNGRSMPPLAPSKYRNGGIAA